MEARRSLGASIFVVDRHHTAGGGDNDLETSYGFSGAYENILVLDTTRPVLLVLNSLFPVWWLNLAAVLQRATISLDRRLFEMLRDGKCKVPALMETGKWTRGSRDLLSFLIKEPIAGNPAASISDRRVADHVRRARHRLRTEVPRSDGPRSQPERGRHRKLAVAQYFVVATRHRIAATDLVIGDLHIPKNILFNLAPAAMGSHSRIWGHDSNGDDVQALDPGNDTSPNRPRIRPGNFSRPSTWKS
ncbi:hypothetical protein PG990_005169 [Apiospora arundinis]